MRNWVSRLSLNQRLALITLVLGAVALFASPYQGGTVTIDAKALAMDVATGADQVPPRELAAWVLGGRADYRLVDIRGEAEFVQSQIPSAENIPAAGLLDAGLTRAEKIIIYGDDGVQSAQAWLLLRATGYRGVYLLKGGMAAWNDQVRFPTLLENPTPEQKVENDKLTAIAAYFGGQARMAGAAGAPVAMPPATATALPKAPPVAPAGGAKAAPKKKKEGC